ncbi:uncharacterized protein VTP21DRAFT_4187 [Calcarisporiella thermophila]|uniref:uncharacterized protein n=1 Tax=Calcarisporiella thermophila TaxID=911321 RepID=UPI003742B1A4
MSEASNLHALFLWRFFSFTSDMVKHIVLKGKNTPLKLTTVLINIIKKRLITNIGEYRNKIRSMKRISR